MPTSTYTDTPTKVRDIGARTTSGDVAVADLSAAEDRLIHEILTEGVVKPFEGYKVRQAATPDMTVRAGSLTANVDLACVKGRVTTSYHGKYLVLLEAASVSLTVPAADATNPRIDEVYLVVADEAYDTTGLALPRLGYRKGDAGATPAPPGPDGAWQAYLLLGTISVAAGETVIDNANITDNRGYSVAEAVGGGWAPTGAVMPFAGSSPPTGWLLAQGQTVSRTTYARLFGVVGTTYGAGDASTTFNVPDMRQRFPLGLTSTGTGSILGGVGGAIEHVHTGPSHTHTMGTHAHSGPSHTHTMGTHVHGQPLHSHGTTGSNGLDAGPDQNVDRYNYKTTGDKATHTHGPTSSTRPDPTDATDPGDTNASGTGNTSATDPGDTNASGTGNTGSGNPPFLTLNYLIKT